MGQTREEITQNLAERLCWEVARRDDARVARRLYRKQVVDGVYRLDEGAVLDDFFHFLRELGVMALLEGVQGTAIQREMVPFVQYVLLYGLKTLFGIESMNALPALLFSDEALMRLVGFNAQQVRQGVCQRGAAKRQGRADARGRSARIPWPTISCKWNLRDLEAVFNGAIRALAKAGVFGAKVTGIADGTDLETTERYAGLWPGDPQGAHRGQAGPGARDRGHGLRLESAPPDRCARPRFPWRSRWGRFRSMRRSGPGPWSPRRGRIWPAMPACTRSSLIKGFLDGTDLWWLDQQGITFVVPAKDEHGGDGGCPGAGRGWGGHHGGPPGAHRPPWAGQNGLDRTAGDRGGRASRG